MKIRMITFHTPLNYGAVLQAYALQTHLKSKCDDVKIIDYKPDTLIKKYNYFKKNTTFRNVVGNIVKLKDYNKYKNKKQKFKEFSDKYFDLTERVVDKKGIEKQVKNVDFVFTGSDQVFNPTRKHLEETDNFYLNFDVDKAKRVAYAASFGIKNIPMGKEEKVKKYLENFDYLSTREIDGKKIISKLIGKDALCVTDPVLLLDENEWKKVEQKVKVPEKYLLCYSLYECELEKQVVEQIAKKLNLKVVLITPNILPKIKYDKCFKQVGPREFLYLMRNASYVVSDSFHGIVFSTIFKKQFLLTVANEATKSRMLSYLNTIGLDDRLCIFSDEINWKDIDYKKVDKKINKQIELSKKYIEYCLDNKDVSELKNDVKDKKIETIEDIKEICTGCGTCILKCPTKAISMKQNEEGFEEPVIDKEKCIKCGKCVLECHTINIKNDEKGIEEAYYGRIKEDSNTDNILKYSSSGGLFYVLAKKIIDEDGIVYGAVLDKNTWKVEHFGSDQKTLKEQMKSKYVQSSTYKSFEKIKKDIEKGRKVLFCGTPCQVAGLKKLIGTNENLITIDFICHGVPSPKVLQDKVKALEEKYNSKVKELFFRSKINNWSQQKIFVEFENGKIYFRDANNDDYFKMFLNNYILRKSCYDCHYSDKKHLSDITLADYWGIKKYNPEENDEKGLSLILLNTKKGKEIFENIKDKLQIKPLEIEKARYVYKTHNTYKFGKRENFFKEYINNGYKSAINKVKDKANIKVKLINYLKVYNYEKAIKKFKKEVKNDKN